MERTGCRSAALKDKRQSVYHDGGVRTSFSDVNRTFTLVSEKASTSTYIAIISIARPMQYGSSVEKSTSMRFMLLE